MKANSTKDINIELYHKIIQRKKELKLTFKDMSINSGIAISTLSTAISALKSGKSITTETLKKIGDSLNFNFFNI